MGIIIERFRLSCRNPPGLSEPLGKETVRMAVTAKELSKILNLSEAAVSMALNHKPGVSTATRKRVLDTARELGYDFSKINEKNAVPQSMNGTVQFILYKRHGAVVADTPFFSQLSEGINLGCKQNHYYLNIFYLYEGEPVESALSDLIRAGSKGIILLGTEMQEADFAPFSNLPIPVVLLDSYFENIRTDCVMINNIQGAYQAVSYLIRKYRKQPGYLRSSYPINNFQERADGFYKAVRASGMSASKSLVHRLTPSMDRAYSDMLSLLDAGEEPARCYFADNDLIACGALKAFQERGYRIPQDVAVAGFDDMPVSSYIEPGLTTINVPKQYMGQVAAGRLAQLIASPGSQPLKIEVATKLVIRKST